MKKLINTAALLIIFLHLNPSVQTQRIIYSISRRPRNQSKEYEQQQWQTNYGSNSTIIHTITNSTLLLRNQHETGRKRTATTTTIVSNDTKDGRSLLRTKRFLKHTPKTSKFFNRTKTIQDSSRDDQDEPQSSHGPKFGNKNISMVLAELLDHYDHNQRPGYGGQAAVITTNLEIRSMGPISELDMEYSLDCYFRQKWQDERLRFTGNANFLSLNIKMLDKIWKPDTYFHTGKASHLHMITTPNKFLRIFKNGLVLYSMRLTIKSLCPMDLHSFPMDKQSCPLILGSYGFPADQLVYSWDAKPVTFNQKDFTLSQFDIVKTIYRNGTIPFKRGNHSMLQVNFNLRRHVGYFLIQIYVPCSLIVVLSWVSFWINREATSDRVGLGVTAVLTLSTFGLDSRSDLPRVSYATALDWYTVMCFLFVVFTLLEFAGVHYFTKVGTGEMPVIEIDDDWTKSSDSDEQQQQQEMDSRNQSEDQKNIIQERGQHRNPSATQLRHRRVHHRPRHRSSRQKTSSKKLKSRKKLTHVVVPRSSSGQPLNIRKFNNDNDNDNQLSDYNETMDDNPIVHMPHCPRYRHCRQQKLRRPIDDDNYVYDGQEWNYPPSSSSTRHHYIRNRHHQHYSQQQQPQQQSWRLNSSWPTLAWGYDGGHDKSKFEKHNLNKQSHLKPPELLEHYSFNQLARTDHDFNDFDYELDLNDKEDIVSDIVHDDDDEDDDGEDDDDGGGTSDSNNNDHNDDHVPLNFCLWRQVFNPLSQCCREFWYCFTANEQFKKEMKRRRTKGQGMCAVNSVSMIDKVSRILFPLVFFILNTAYWSFYINERNADFQQWET